MLTKYLHLIRKHRTFIFKIKIDLRVENELSEFSYYSAIILSILQIVYSTIVSFFHYKMSLYGVQIRKGLNGVHIPIYIL